MRDDEHDRGRLLSGKAAVVTGAGRGIGRCHALHLAAAGAAVVVNDIEAAAARDVVEEIEHDGGRAVAAPGDVSDREASELIIEHCCARFGAIDALVANAGIVRTSEFLEISDEDFDDVLRVHLYGTFYCGRAAGRRMRDQDGGGAIVNTTSTAALGIPGQASYAAAKGAITSLTWSMARELARHGIRVNAIAPSGTTRMRRSGSPSDEPFFDPAQNAPLVVWLCSDEARWVTGQWFATGGERVALLGQPDVRREMRRPGGWSLESLREAFPTELSGHLEPFGIERRPDGSYDRRTEYPDYEGVRRRPRE